VIMFDLRLALRGMIRSPGPTAVVVLTLGVAIGATTIVYSTIDVVWHMIPAADTDRLVFVASTDPRPSQSQSGMSGGLALTGTSVPDLVDWTGQSTTIEQFGAFRHGSATLTGLDAPLRVSIVHATANLPSMWGFGAVLGRGFTPDEGRPGAEPVAMITHAFWQRQFSSRPEVLGWSILLNGTPHTIVGVLPAEAGTGIFGQRDFIVPLALDAARSARDERRLYVTARLKEGVTREQAAADLDTIAKRLQTEYPRTNAQTGVVVRPLIELIGGETPFVLFLLALIAVLVVAMACANVSNVILAQAATRQHELSLRTALGASRFDHVRRFMIESFVVSAAAGAVGLLVASWGIAGVRWLAGPRFAQSSLNGRVLLVGAMTSFVVPFAFALLPALRSSRPDPMHLREDARSAGAGSGRGLRNVLVAVQVALAMILMVQIALVGRTAWKFRTAEYGFDPAHVLTLRVDLPDTKYPDATRITQFYTDLLARIDAVPGVASATAINHLPIGDRELSVRVAVEGAPSVDADELPFAALATITRDYLRTLRVPLLSGRGFNDADFGRGPAVALVSEEAARRLWKGTDPVGRRITLNTPPLPNAPLIVVGVVANARSSDLDRRVMPQVYVPSSWHPERAMAVVVRTDSADPIQLVPAIRAQAAQVDPNEPIFAVASMEQVLFNDLSGTYTIAGLLAGIALVALCLAATGIYGVVSYSVTQRTREIGVRMALGARPRAVLRMVIGQGAVPVVAGGVLGLLAAFAFAHLMSTSVGFVDARDPRSYAGVILSMVLVAFAASYVPARRASHVDPVVALRAD
jgi:putative ABC transport system permease protein